MSPNPRAPNIPEGTSGKKRQALLYLYSLSKGASFFKARRGVGWDGGSTPLDHRRSLSVPFTAHCPPGSRRSPALDSNSAAPGSRPGAPVARSWGARGEAGGARTDLDVRTQLGPGDTGEHTPGSRPRALAGCSRRRTPASASNALASQARWASEGAPLKSANPLLTPIRPPSPGVGSLFALGFRGGEESLLSTQVGRLAEVGAAGWGAGCEPRGLRLPWWRAPLAGSAARRPAGLFGWWARARAVRGCQSAVAAPKARELSGAAVADPAHRPGRGSAEGTQAPSSVSRRTNPELGAGPGEAGKGRPEGHPDEGLDLVGRFLWQPGRRG